MGKRHLNDTNELEPSRKKPHNGIQPGDIVYDISGKTWKLGNPVGQGAFGEIFVASDCITKEVDERSPYVAKIELHANGPLFVETHFYLRAAKQEQINEWTLKTRKTIGLPNFIASGSHIKFSTKYRFLILPRYSIDIQKVLDKHDNKFNIKTVITIALQLLDVLEYIHSKGFIHADIKASNILINELFPLLSKTQEIEKCYNNTINLENTTRANKCNQTLIRACKTRRITRNLRPNKYLAASLEVSEPEAKLTPQEDLNNNVDTNQVYLLDFGLASKYLHSNGDHKPYCIDVRKAHAGTILFCSLDAHNGASSRRSDLESLGYNMVHWLTGTLPWTLNVDDYEIVKKKKQICMQELNNFLHISFDKNTPVFLKSYFAHVKSLEFAQKPDYEFLRKVLIQGLTEYGYKKVFTLDFKNKEGWGIKKKRIWNSENDPRRASVVGSIIRTPLKSNLPQVVLRKKNNAKARMLRWSNILIDPEVIIKSGKKVKDKVHDDSDYADAIQRLNLDELNPTEAMIHVYNNYFERHNNMDIGLIPKHKGDGSPAIQGYNATMMTVYNKKLQRDEVGSVKMPKKRGRPPRKLLKGKTDVPKSSSNKSNTDENLKEFTSTESLMASDNTLSEYKSDIDLTLKILYKKPRGRPKGQTTRKSTKVVSKIRKYRKKPFALVPVPGNEILDKNLTRCNKRRTRNPL